MKAQYRLLRSINRGPFVDPYTHAPPAPPRPRLAQATPRSPMVGGSLSASKDKAKRIQKGGRNRTSADCFCFLHSGGKLGR